LTRVLALVGEGGVPPERLEGLSDEQVNELKMEYDVVQALSELGHRVELLGVSHDLTRIRAAIETHEPQVVFNMLEDFQGYVTFDAHVVAYLELLRMAYTGSNPRGLVLSRDKALTKKICTYHRIRVPRFAVFRRGRKARVVKRLQYPLIVKSLMEDASRGIAQASLVQSQEQLGKRVEFVHEQIGDDAIAEEFIDGRELYLGVLGNQRLQTFPLWELDLASLPDGAPRIATARIKWDLEYQEKHGIKAGAAVDLPEGLAARVARMGKRIYRMLGLSGYARLDFRLREDGDIFLLEANANPDLSRDEDFALAAEAAGLDYGRLIQRILNLGLRASASPARR
jgi:D-alanine-D-alanine ligase